MFQSTLPRRERLARPDPLKILRAVSIHAPTKGATKAHAKDLPILWFQSTLPRRERLHHDPVTWRQKCFNPRSHEGSDEFFALMFQSPFFVSIHAPTKGATTAMNINYLAFRFQSTLPRRERPCPNALDNSPTMFQSTLPRRERPGSHRDNPDHTSFNPRSHEGSDRSDRSKPI